MGQQRIVGAFPSFRDAEGRQINIYDFPIPATSGWTDGATLITPITIQPALGATWAVVAYTIQFAGVINFNEPQAFGKLGKIIGAIIQGSVATPALAPAAGGFVTPMLPIPDIRSDMTVLWDGSTDPIFAARSDTGPPEPDLPVVSTVVLSTPIEISAGEAVSIGLWLTPSLVNQAQIEILNATFALVIDDGQPRQAYWGT